MDIELPVSRERLRPGKLVCVGRNYARHAEEMESDVPAEPMLFLKPSTSLVGPQSSVVLPRMTRSVHHEIELVIVIGRTVRSVPEEEAAECIAGYAVGLDMTARDLQAEAKKRGHPWSVAKGFDTFAPLGSFAAPDAVADPRNITLDLRVNGRARQHGSTADMIFSPEFLIHFASQIFTLERGDLIFTGTPEGVGQVQPGDVLEATATGLPSLTIRVADRTPL